MTNPTYTAAAHLLTTARQNGQLVKGCLPELIGHLFDRWNVYIIAQQFDPISLEADYRAFLLKDKDMAMDVERVEIAAINKTLAAMRDVLGMPVDTRTPIERMMGVQSGAGI